jgi:hypothetical protein
MKKTMIFAAIVSIACLSALFVSCEKSEPLPKVFIGQWKFDSSTFENDPKLKQMKDDPKSKQAFDLIANAFGSLSVVITDTTFSLDMPGSQSGRGNTSMNFTYKVTGTKDGAATIVNKDKGASGGRYRLELIDGNHMKMVNIINESQPMEVILARVK